MTRLLYGILFVFAISCMPFTVGCGGSGDVEVIEQEATDSEMQEADDYEAEAEKQAAEEATQF